MATEIQLPCQRDLSLIFVSIIFSKKIGNLFLNSVSKVVSHKSSIEFSFSTIDNNVAV